MGAALRRVPGVLTIAGTQDAGTESGQKLVERPQGELECRNGLGRVRADAPKRRDLCVVFAGQRGMSQMLGSRSINLLRACPICRRNLGAVVSRLCVAAWLGKTMHDDRSLSVF